MSDLKLFRIDGGVATEVRGSDVALEKSLQAVIERNMGTLFGVRFLASEYPTGARHGGRIDSLGLDENNSPVIFEYKRATNENVINQGLFYLDWLLDHRGEFHMLVLNRLGADVADKIEWTNPRTVCVAGGYTKYDEHAVQQINRRIELWRYRDFDGRLLALELTTAVRTETAIASEPVTKSASKIVSQKTVLDYLAQSPADLKDLYAELDAFCESLGDDVTKNPLKLYVAYRRAQNFACVEVHPVSKHILVYLKLDPASVDLVEGLIRDVTNIGHFGTGNVEARVSTPEQLRDVLPLIQRSYESN